MFKCFLGTTKEWNAIKQAEINRKVYNRTSESNGKMLFDIISDGKGIEFVIREARKIIREFLWKWKTNNWNGMKLKCCVKMLSDVRKKLFKWMKSKRNFNYEFRVISREYQRKSLVVSRAARKRKESKRNLNWKLLITVITQKLIYILIKVLKKKVEVNWRPF